MGVGAHGWREAARQAEISKLEGIGATVHQNILRLEVAVNDQMRMRVLDALQDLVHVELQSTRSSVKPPVFRTLEIGLTAKSSFKARVQLRTGAPCLPLDSAVDFPRCGRGTPRAQHVRQVG